MPCHHRRKKVFAQCLIFAYLIICASTNVKRDFLSSFSFGPEGGCDCTEATWLREQDRHYRMKEMLIVVRSSEIDQKFGRIDPTSMFFMVMVMNGFKAKHFVLKERANFSPLTTTTATTATAAAAAAAAAAATTTTTTTTTQTVQRPRGFVAKFGQFSPVYSLILSASSCLYHCHNTKNVLLFYLSPLRFLCQLVLLPKGEEVVSFFFSLSPLSSTNAPLSLSLFWKHVARVEEVPVSSAAKPTAQGAESVVLALLGFIVVTTSRSDHLMYLQSKNFRPNHLMYRRKGFIK